MKTFKHIAFVLIVLLLASCSNVNENLEKVIPADAAGVVCINMESVISKSGLINNDSKIELPASLKPIVDENDGSSLNQLLTDLPVMGVNTDSKIYAFFTLKTFGSVIVMSLDNEDAAREVIERRTGADFKEVEGLNCVYQEDVFYTIQDNTLFIGKVNKPMEVSKPASTAKRMLSRGSSSIADDKEIKACLDAENDVNAFLRVDGLKLLLNSSNTYREISRKMPLLEVFTESDVQAYVASLNFNEHDAVLDVQVKVDDNSEYIKLLSSTLSAPSADFLKAIPVSMDYIVAMSVKGADFVKLPQIVQLVKMFKKMPFIGRLDIESMLSTIDGPVAIGLARDPNLDEWNAVVAAKSTNPNAVVGQIAAFASALGQRPEVYDGDYIYQYENKMIKIGVKEGILYVKMLNYEQTEGYAFENDEARTFFEKSPMGVYVRSSKGNNGGSFKGGLNDLKTIKGMFVPADKNANSTVALLQVLCGIKPNSVFEKIEQNENYMPGAIDELKPVN